MSIQVVVGAQFGDEGKGKMVDYYAADADLVARFQGGDNAGHTVINDLGIFKLHLIPCGIFYPGCTCLVGTGVVVNPDVLLEEMADLAAAGISSNKLVISSRAHILLPAYAQLDGCMEASGGIGTTKRGVGQAYAFRALRKGLVFDDLRDDAILTKKISALLPVLNNLLQSYGGQCADAAEILSQCKKWRKALGNRIVDATALIRKAREANQRILFEGQLGAMKDLDLGIYPYVTASHPVAAYAAVSGGFPARCIDRVTGIAKAFSSAVGAGPFPTEMRDTEAAVLRGVGDKPDDEYGARTGRARRIGWLDLPILEHANRVNGFDELVLTKLDKLDDMPEIKVCIRYLLDGQPVMDMPRTDDLERVQPVYATLPGWMSSTKGIKAIAKLPENARKYIDFIAKSLNVPVTLVGVGPHRRDVAE